MLFRKKIDPRCAYCAKGTRPAYTGVPNTTRSLSQKESSFCRAWGRVKSKLRQGTESIRASSPATLRTVRSVVPVPLK